MLRLSLILFIFLPTQLQALDLKFRFKDGYCQKSKHPGTNPEFFGECGNLTSGRLIYKNSENKNFQGSIYNSSYIYTSHFKGGNVSNSSIRRAIVLQTTFKDLEAQSLDIRGSHFKGVHFENANVTNLLANGTRFTKTKFINCNLKNADFWGSQLLEMDFSNSDLSNANFTNTIVLLSHFKGAKFNSKTKLPFSKEEAIKRGMVKVE